MSDTPRLCVYCEGQRADCGFCEDGVPLESREELERGWRAVFRLHDAQRVAEVLGKEDAA